MFENLQEKLQRAFKTLRGEAKLSEENIDEALREIRMALLEADVNFKVVKQLIEQIKAKGRALHKTAKQVNRVSCPHILQEGHELGRSKGSSRWRDREEASI